MARNWSFLLLIVLSLLATTTAHAREYVSVESASSSTACGGLDHDGADGSSDVEPDKGVPHHHGACHAHVFGMPSTADLEAASAAVGQMPIAGQDFTPPSGSVDPAQRPPNA